MNQTQFITEVYEVAWASNPDLDHSSSFQDVLKELSSCIDKALKLDIISAAFKPEPQLPKLPDMTEPGDFRMEGNTLWL